MTERGVCPGGHGPSSVNARGRLHTDRLPGKRLPVAFPSQGASFSLAIWPAHFV